MSRLRQVLLALPLPFVLIGLWQVGVTQQWELPLDIRMANVPTPLAVLNRLRDFAFGGVIDDAFSGTFATHLWASASRVLTGFTWAALLAVPTGVAMGRSRLVSSAVEPTISLLRPVPVTAWVPLVLIVIGLGSRATVVLVFLACVYPILLNTIAGVKAVPPRLMEAADMLGTKPVARLWRVVLPAALPSILTGMRVALGFGWVIVVVGETVGVTTGFGSVIIEAQQTSKTDLIVAGMAFIGLAGFATDKAMTGLIRVALRDRPLL